MSNSHLAIAQAALTQHVAEADRVLTLLNNLGTNSAATVATAVAAATADLSASNDALIQGINASTARLQEAFATHAGAVASAAPAKIL